ncbi:hypothetical protein LTR56_018034 [Elasticomyces elasticus]|nr:hypothetical protein LTR56_018034 [Elasticomyces elasticus]KAK4915875.1 hypothetical protein LTR49_016021 [Elasticomyces elasticus]KAK5755321.1 hypothetical protein LTS12_014550 [Elasticomyces elasticus]
MAPPSLSQVQLATSSRRYGTMPTPALRQRPRWVALDPRRRPVPARQPLLRLHLHVLPKPSVKICQADVASQSGNAVTYTTISYTTQTTTSFATRTLTTIGTVTATSVTSYYTTIVSTQIQTYTTSYVQTSTLISTLPGTTITATSTYSYGVTTTPLPSTVTCE